GQPVCLGAGAYAGPSHTLSCSLPLTGPPSSMRALLATALHVIVGANPVHMLRLYSVDLFLPHAVCHWALEHAKWCWSCPHGDLLQRIATVLRARPAPVGFYFI
ncbi:hypothetical protein C8T65DRAFT_529016, partial [Cerioporus squamosus]